MKTIQLSDLTEQEKYDFIRLILRKLLKPGLVYKTIHTDESLDRFFSKSSAF